uniref:DUF7083 domain-containing protein n=1 Tax=Ditylenchus dipsaci TaxID=166011 RepID=A0A915CN36_9BILA
MKTLVGSCVILFALAAIAYTFGIRTKQAAGAQGYLTCDGRPAANILVKLYDKDRSNLQQQQQQFLAALQAMQVQAPPLPANAQPNPAPIDRLMQSLSLRLSEFVYDPDENDTFDRWYARYQDVFTADAEVLDDATKARLLVSRLGKTEFQRFANNILPQQPRDISFDDTVAKLQSLFAPTHSLFNRRYKCLS